MKEPELEQRGRWGRGLRAVLSPIYYWLDWYDSQRHPAFNKVKPGLAFLLCTALEVAIGIHLLTHTASASEVEWGLLFAFTVLNVFASYGLAGLKLWSEARGFNDRLAPGGRAGTDAILTRRAIVGGDHEVTP